MTFIKKCLHIIKKFKQVIVKFMRKEYKPGVYITVLTTTIIASAICVAIVVAYAIVESNHYGKWANAYIQEYEVEYDRYNDVVCAIADASIGIPISNERKEQIKNSVLPETYASIKSILNKDIHIGEVQETEKTVEEKMDAIFGGADAVDYNKYYMEVIERNFYYPDMYVFKLVNTSGNTAIITLYLYENGGIRDVKTSI